MDSRFCKPASVFITAVLVVMADICVIEILQQSLYRRASTTIVLVFDFGIVLLAGLLGLFFATRLGCPIWWRSRDSIQVSQASIFITLLLASLIVAANTLICIASRNQLALLAPWVKLLTPPIALALAFRAALAENIVFRLFLFPLVAWVINLFVPPKRVALIAGALVSAFIFGLIHPGFAPAFLAGLAVVYIYYQHGLLVAMAVHFFADAIPFIFLSTAT